MNSFQPAVAKSQQPTDDDFIYELLAEMRLP